MQLTDKKLLFIVMIANIQKISSLIDSDDD